VASLAVSPDSVAMEVGESTVLSAVPRDRRGNLIDATVSWQSTDPAILTVSATGGVTGVAPGTAHAVAATGDQRDSAVVVVLPESPPRAAADAFDRADGPLGPTWLDENANLEVVSGEVGLISAAGSSLATWTADAFGPDQFSEVTVGTMAGGSFADFRGLQVFVRWQAATGWRYGFHYFSNTRTYQIKCECGPSNAVIAESSVAALPGPGDVFRIEVTGGTVRGFLNGGLVLEAQSSQLSAGGTGFVIGVNLGVTFVPRRVVDAWRGGELQ
jgi:hypothetical protein